MSPPTDSAAGVITLRTELRPGDLGLIVHLHGVTYARERGFDPTFEAYVAGPLADMVRAASPRERIWIAERDGRMVGCVAIVAAGPRMAQLRWFLVEPDARDRIVLAVQWLSGWDRPIRKVEAAPRAARQLAGRKGG